jgi:hypothetical protein
LAELFNLLQCSVRFKESVIDHLIEIHLNSLE